MAITTNIVLDLANNSRKHIVEVKQSDRSSRTLRFTILNKSVAYDMTSVYTATFKGIKPDDSVIYASGDIETDDDGENINIVDYTMSDAALSVTGTITFELQLLASNGEIINSFEFYVNVINQLYDEDDLLSESDLSGFKAYLVRTLNAAVKTESTEAAFEAAYGSITEIKEEMEEKVEECEAFLEYLQELLDTGAFIGARGPQGENGADAVVTEGSQIMGFQIVDGNLVCYYCGDETPAIAMNDDGDLEWTL